MAMSISEADSHLQLNLDQLSLLRELKQWVEKEADFYGRTDEDFLVLFLRSCDFDLKVSKKTLRLYYEARVKYPEWCANRDFNEPQIRALLSVRPAVLLLDQQPNSPTVGIVHFSRLGNDSSILGPAGKYFGCGLDITSRRRNCQLHGCVVILDFDHMPWWLVWKCLWPPYVKSLFNAFLFCMPFKMKSMIMVNAPTIASTVLNISKSFIPQAHKNKLQCCRSWNEIGQCVPLELLPVEYGGHAGPAKMHEDASVDELLAMNDYFVDDNKYGFQFAKF